LREIAACATAVPDLRKRKPEKNEVRFGARALL